MFGLTPELGESLLLRPDLTSQSRCNSSSCRLLSPYEASHVEVMERNDGAVNMDDDTHDDDDDDDD